jgi:hypothetical protein
MKLLLLLAALGVVGYFIYQDYFAAPTEPPKPTPSPSVSPTPPPTPRPTPVPLAIRGVVRNLYEEWKRRELGDVRAATLPRPSELRTQIKSILFDQGHHSDGAMREVIVKALGELGVQPSDREHITSGIMSMQ